jgi:hypothetical protein
MSKEKQFVAMTHETCPICGKDTNEGILLHTRFGDLSAVHDKSTGFSAPCEECQAAIDQGAIIIIVADQKRSGTEFKDLYRTGNIFGVREEAVRQMLSGDPLTTVLEKRVMVMDYPDAIQIGLPVVYDPETGQKPKE